MKQKYGLIGFPLGHSFSKSFFNEKFQSENIHAEYINYEIPEIKKLKKILTTEKELCGLNVTLPYKEAVIPYLDEIDDVARKIGAVNVIKFIRSGNQLKTKGYNSDIIGFSDSIEPLLTEARSHALVLGTGGAAKAICVGLENLGIEVTKVSRVRKPGCISYDDITPEIMFRNKIIVNTTPLGMYPNIESCPNIQYDKLTPEHLCYDLIYNPDETLFLKKSAQYGAETKNGLEMLLLQAFATWDIWHR